MLDQNWRVLRCFACVRRCSRVMHVMTPTHVVTLLLVLVVMSDVVRWHFLLLISSLMHHFFMVVVIFGSVIDCCCWSIESWMMVWQMRRGCHCVVMMWVVISRLGVRSTVVQVCVTESVVRGDNNVFFVLLWWSLWRVLYMVQRPGVGIVISFGSRDDVASLCCCCGRYPLFIVAVFIVVHALTTCARRWVVRVN